MSGKLWLICLLALASVCGAARGQEAEQGARPETNTETERQTPTPEELPAVYVPADYLAAPEDQETAQLTLQQCLLLMLVNNYDIQIEQISPEIAAEEILVARSVFDPVIQLEGSQENTTEPTVDELQVGIGTTGIQEAVRDNSRVFAALAKRFRTGGTLRIEYEYLLEHEPTDPFRGFNPTHDTRTSIILTHPLLRNVGIFVNSADIYLATHEKQASERRLRSQILGNTFRTAEAYWRLVNARASYRASLSSLERARDFLNLVKDQIAEGAAAKSDIHDAQAEVAVQEDNVEGFKLTVLNTEAELKRLLNMKEGTQLSRARIVPVDEPVFVEPRLEIRAAERVAMRMRPELDVAKIQKAQARIRRRVAKNQKLPVLDVELSYGLLGLGRDYPDSHETLGKADFREKRAALSFSYPIFNRAAEARLQQAHLSKRQANLVLSNEKQQVVLEVRTTARRVKRTANRVGATRAIYAAREEAYKAMRSLYREGKATPFDVVQSLERLAIADRDVQTALGEYRIALNEFHLAMGDIDRFHNVQLGGATGPEAPEPETADSD